VPVDGTASLPAIIENRNSHYLTHCIDKWMAAHYRDASSRAPTPGRDRRTTAPRNPESPRQEEAPA
jgi:hypothetical protein